MLLFCDVSPYLLLWLNESSVTRMRERLKLWHVTRVFWAIYNQRESAAEDSGVKPKNISCINPFQDADYSQAVLQAAAERPVQRSADKAITCVILAPSLLKSASNPHRFRGISVFLPSERSEQKSAEEHHFKTF